MHEQRFWPRSGLERARRISAALRLRTCDGRVGCRRVRFAYAYVYMRICRTQHGFRRAERVLRSRHPAAGFRLVVVFAASVLLAGNECCISDIQTRFLAPIVEIATTVPPRSNRCDISYIQTQHPHCNRRNCSRKFIRKKKECCISDVWQLVWAPNAVSAALVLNRSNRSFISDIQLGDTMTGELRTRRTVAALPTSGWAWAPTTSGWAWAPT